MANKGEAQVEAIWLKMERGGAMTGVLDAHLVEGVGIEGNADQGGYRQVTLLDADAWEAATAELEVELDPTGRRANLLIRGVDLAETNGRVLCVAGCQIQIRGEMLPCDLMDTEAQGLKEALTPEWRAGVYGMVIEGGPVTVGDSVYWDS